ncbi:MAG TPA: hypothetical protein VFX42_02190, partial [Gemmatimonadales bacterium]|nr:hypothetical protein [Gemmatimonadales bacterium]
RAGAGAGRRALRPGVVGNTCCHLGDLSNKLPDLTQRIEYIFALGLDRPNAGLIGKVKALGEVPADRIDGPDRRTGVGDLAFGSRWSVGRAAPAHAPGRFMKVRHRSQLRASNLTLRDQIL